MFQILLEASRSKTNLEKKIFTEIVKNQRAVFHI